MVSSTSTDIKQAEPAHGAYLYGPFSRCSSYRWVCRTFPEPHYRRRSAQHTGAKRLTKYPWRVPGCGSLSSRWSLWCGPWARGAGFSRCCSSRSPWWRWFLSASRGTQRPAVTTTMALIRTCGTSCFVHCGSAAWRQWSSTPCAKGLTWTLLSSDTAS